VARGSTIVAAESEPLNPKTGGGGLYRSIDGGTSFQQIQVGAGIPAGAVSSLVSAGAGAPLYAVVNSTDPLTRGVYKSINDGANWSQVSSATQVPVFFNQSARLAAGPNGSVAAAVYQYTSSDPNSSSAKLVGLYLSQDG